ncbi:UPF0236 family protein [Aerococcaceae bacterium zg-ZUI334]|nr:UPF0236 family protein [Aerococcaceae bacterium zg-ZUI334]
MDFSSCIQTVNETMNRLGVDLVEDMMNSLEASLYEMPRRKLLYSVVRKEPKVISTLMGDVMLNRRYYRHKETKEYSHLLDDYLGLTPHQRMDIGLEIELYKRALSTSYQKAIDSFEQIGISSRQAVK